MRTEVIKISDHLELVRDIDRPDWYSFTEAWKRHAPRDEHGNPNPSMAPYKWKRLPTAQGYINAVQKKLGNWEKISLFASHGQNGLYGHYL